MPTLGRDGQLKLARASIAVIGAGGVKSPLLLYLAAAGVGRITVIDYDRVELSNLNRQILYRTTDVGRFKVEAAVETLRSLNPEIRIEGVNARAVEQTYTSLLANHDLVIEGGDSAQSRKAFNRWALREGCTYIHASAQYNYGYVFTVVPRQSACFECCFADLPDSHGGAVPVIGTAAGVAGCVGASEAIGILAGKAPSLDSELFFFDGWSNWSARLSNTRRSDCEACGTPDRKRAGKREASSGA